MTIFNNNFFTILQKKHKKNIESKNNFNLYNFTSKTDIQFYFIIL